MATLDHQLEEEGFVVSKGKTDFIDPFRIFQHMKKPDICSLFATDAQVTVPC